MHPVSSPALTASILTGFVIAGQGAFLRRLGYGCIAAACAILVMLPYILIYAAKFAGTIAVDPAVAKKALHYAHERLSPEFFDIRLFVGELIPFVLSSPKFWCVTGLLGCLVAFRRRTPTVRFLLGAGLGFSIVVFLIPAIDQFLAWKQGRFPFQCDLIRNIRSTEVFLLTVVCVGMRFWQQKRFEIPWPSWILSWKPLDLRRVRTWGFLFMFVFYLPSVCMTGAQFGWQSSQNASLLVGGPLKSWLRCELEVVRTIQALRKPNELVWGPLYFREAKIPLTYLRKDLGSLAYSNPVELVRARQAIDESQTLLTENITEENVLQAARILYASLLVIRKDRINHSLNETELTIYQNEKFLLLRVDGMQRTEIAAATEKNKH